VRDFWRGAGTKDRLAARVDGSPDIFEASPSDGVNFITAHDGFTLADLVSYDHKHNEANREENRDGHGDNRSWNSGVEGPTDDPAVNSIRRRRAAALMTTLFVSDGVPMMLGGDELGRSQAGNNNAYPIDDPTAWYDWSTAPLKELVGRLSDLRRRYPGLTAGKRQWSAVADSAAVRADLDQLVVVFNPSGDEFVIDLPGGRWLLVLDSAGLDDGSHYAHDAPIPSWSVRLFARAWTG
jgi:glycogen operon protein